MACRDFAFTRQSLAALRHVTWCAIANNLLQMQDDSGRANLINEHSLAVYIQGIRRVIAVTASGAEEAVSKAEGLTIAMDAAEKLQGAQLDAEIAGLRQVTVRLWQSSLQLLCKSQLDIDTCCQALHWHRHTAGSKFWQIADDSSCAEH